MSEPHEPSEPERPRIPILYRDEAVVVVAKPSGLVVHRGWAQDRVVMMSLVRNQLRRDVYPAHRLDRGTSGALLFALSPETLRVLNDAFEAGRVEKRYLALVRGRPDPAEGLVDYAIPRTEDGERVPAQTRYHVVHQLDHYAWVEAFPLTGRLHQVRRHFKHLRHPIVLDKAHGRGRFNARCQADCGIARMALHAASITFPHPLTSTPVKVVAPLPEDLLTPLRRLGVPDTHLLLDCPSTNHPNVGEGGAST
ncbi:MAG: pseudouridine synthase [Polyangiales bacterium]|nr:pseudouridylate synthase [Sandaracinaceae bacterium]